MVIHIIGMYIKCGPHGTVQWIQTIKFNMSDSLKYTINFRVEEKDLYSFFTRKMCGQFADCRKTNIIAYYFFDNFY